MCLHDFFFDSYRPAARRGAILFFVLSEMANINSMYQFSLAAFLGVFEFSLRKSMPDSILKNRLDNIIAALTLNVYNYACTGVYFYFHFFFLLNNCLFKSSVFSLKAMVI